MASNQRRYPGRWILVAACLLAACGGSSPSPAATIPVTSTPYPQATPLVFPMLGVGTANAGITGDAEVVKGSGAFKLTLRLHGLPPNSDHTAHIHLGSCAAMGPIEIPLESLSADATGNATSVTNVPREYRVPDGGWYADVHQRTDAQGGNASPMACGDLKAA
ncbi:MAG TPA: CHRD domain-containing protein [Candidatus Dormibacteraeota bacterium]